MTRNSKLFPYILLTLLALAYGSVLLSALMRSRTVSIDPELIPVSAILTGYSSEVIQTDDTPFHTANGEHVRWGGIACPRKYPFGTRVMAAGEIFECNDRMAYKNDWGEVERFDIWFPSRESAEAFGRTQQEIFLIGNLKAR